MTSRGKTLLPLFLTALAAGLSTGQQLYYLIFLTGAVCYTLSLLSILWLKLTLRSRVTLREKRVDRSEYAHLILSVTHRCLLPVSAARAVITCGQPLPETGMILRPLKENILESTLPTPHVGEYPCGVQHLEVTDLFGLFRFVHRPGESGTLLVLPVPYELEDIQTLPGDEGQAMHARSQEDYSSPEDVRKYLPGDALKRIHWKLSSRRQELLVRTYETPAPPDVLLLLDPFRPLLEHPDTEDCALLRDALTETACSVAKRLLEAGTPVRMPFWSAPMEEFSGDSSLQFPLVREALARQSFERDGIFDQAILMEARQLRRTGAVLLFTTRLSPQVVQAAAQLRRMGPAVRLYLVSFTPEREDWAPLVSRLQNALVEVCYVTP